MSSPHSHNPSGFKALFILKYRANGPYGSWNYCADSGPTTKLANGLNISAGQVVSMLNDAGIPTKQVHVIDNNDIDREVTLYRPTHVFIEAFWVVPEKFDILKKLHPKVTWIVRNHSKMDFLAMEGSVIGWALEYIKRGVVLACNSPEATLSFIELAKSIGADPSKVVYLPNYYVLRHKQLENQGKLWSWRFNRNLGFRPNFKQSELKVGCFGALRPLKNNLDQAIGAILAADALGVPLLFAINANRIEGGSSAPLFAIRALFNSHPKHKLIEIPWMEHEKFLDIIRLQDVVTQVSNSETFNIVGADAVHEGVPLVGSSEIPWLDSDEFMADPHDVFDIRNKIIRAAVYAKTGFIQAEQYNSLSSYVERSKELWLKYLHPHH